MYDKFVQVREFSMSKLHRKTRDKNVAALGPLTLWFILTNYSPLIQNYRQLFPAKLSVCHLSSIKIEDCQECAVKTKSCTSS